MNLEFFFYIVFSVSLSVRSCTCFQFLISFLCPSLKLPFQVFKQPFQVFKQSNQDYSMPNFSLAGQALGTSLLPDGPDLD